MSRRSVYFEECSNEIKSAYHNYVIKNCNQTQFYAYNIGYYFARSRGMDIAEANRQGQIAAGIEVNKDFVLQITSNLLGPELTGAFRSLGGFDYVLDTPGLYKYYEGFTPTRDKFNVRRTYWTGTPKRRKNLT